MGIEDFDINNAFGIIKDVILKVLSYPVKFWFYYVPDWVKWTFLGIILFFALLIIILWIKYRDAWRDRYF